MRSRRQPPTSRTHDHPRRTRECTCTAPLCPIFTRERRLDTEIEETARERGIGKVYNTSKSHQKPLPTLRHASCASPCRTWTVIHLPRPWCSGHHGEMCLGLKRRRRASARSTPWSDLPHDGNALSKPCISTMHTQAGV